MKLLLKGIFFIFFTLNLLLVAKAQHTPPDSLISSSEIDTLQAEPIKQHYPRKATMYSAVLPGLGQIYNKQWWKVPFIYGGFAYIGYTINDKHQYNLDVRQAYLDLIDGDLTTDSYRDIDGFEDISETSPGQAKTSLYKIIGNSAQSRDTYILVAAAFYLINILDANVNAHFLDFDISEDLSLNLTPVYSPLATSYPLPGITLVYNF